MGHATALSSGSILLHGLIHFLLLMLFEAVKEITGFKKVMVTHMPKIQSSPAIHDRSLATQFATSSVQRCGHSGLRLLSFDLKMGIHQKLLGAECPAHRTFLSRGDRRQPHDRSHLSLRQPKATVFFGRACSTPKLFRIFGITIPNNSSPTTKPINEAATLG
jgi:hypothetical protein